jgi:hypothetical protein
MHCYDDADVQYLGDSDMALLRVLESSPLVTMAEPLLIYLEKARSD